MPRQRRAPTGASLDLALGLEVLRRNARLRAWRGAGVPVEGHWERRSPGAFTLFLGCAACGQRASRVERIRPLLLKRLPRVEAAAVESLRRRCSHLAPILGADPPEVLAITELELLAGS
jgi:ribosomal protein L34E